MAKTTGLLSDGSYVYQGLLPTPGVSGGLFNKPSTGIDPAWNPNPQHGTWPYQAMPTGMTYDQQRDSILQQSTQAFGDLHNAIASSGVPTMANPRTEDTDTDTDTDTTGDYSDYETDKIIQQMIQLIPDVPAVDNFVGDQEAYNYLIAHPEIVDAYVNNDPTGYEGWWSALT